MKKVRILLIPLFCLAFLFVFAYLPSNKTFAIGHDASPAYRDENTDKVTVTFTGINQSVVYFCLHKTGKCGGSTQYLIEGNVVDGSASIEVCGDGTQDLKKGACGANDFFWATNYDVWIFPDRASTDTCDSQACTNPDHAMDQIEFNVNHYYPIPSFDPVKPVANNEFIFKLTGVKRVTTDEGRNAYRFDMDDNNGNAINACSEQNWSTVPAGYFQKPCTLAEGIYFLTIRGQADRDHNDGFTYYKIRLEVTPEGGNITVSVDPNNKDANELVNIPGLKTVAGNGSNPCSATGCETALGFIPTSVKGFTQKILGIATGLAGGIALILMVIGSIRVLTSSGDPKAVAGGREMIVAAVAGLLFLIFATLILRFIGINIIGI